MHIEKDIMAKAGKTELLLRNARAEYTNGKAEKNSVPADYRVLFVLFRSVTISDRVYTIDKDSVKEKIFYEAVSNFKYSAENFADGNVNIIPVIKEVISNVVSKSDTYLKHEDISDILAEISPVGVYDAVFSVSAPDWVWGGGTLAQMFSSSINNNHSFYGYSGCSINMTKDPENVGKGFDRKYPYLITTNIFIHEWLHQLESYRNVLKDLYGESIIYPFVHAYYCNYQNDPSEDWMNMKSYKWNEDYFSDEKTYPHVAERRITSFYRAVLACDIEYIPRNNHKVGMYPSFWQITPHKIVFGRYIIQDSHSRYLFGSERFSITRRSRSLKNSKKYHWNVFYDLRAGETAVIRQSCVNSKCCRKCFLQKENYIPVKQKEEL